MINPAIKIFCILLWAFNSLEVAAQFSQFEQEEDSLLSIAPLVISSNTDSAKLAAAEQLQTRLVKVLSNPTSFDYQFSNLRMSTVAIASHPKANVRIFSFNIILQNGVFHHYGVIQLKTKIGVSLWPLHDTAQNLPNDAKEMRLEYPQWIGGLYYQLFPHKVKKTQYYIVMLFDGHNINSNRSIIDVLSFQKDLDSEDPKAIAPVWGAPIFRDGLDDPSEEMRVIMEYHKSARILMRYEVAKKIIVFDEVGPPFSAVAGNPYYYIPTGDYSGYRASKRGIFTREALEVLDFGQGIEDPKIYR